MPLTCSAALFFYEWKACWEDETRKTDKLYWMVKPFLDRWALHLRNPEQGYEVNFVSMMSLLQSNGDPYELVHNWVRVQDANTSVEDTLVLLFFERLRNYRFIPKNIQGVYAEYCIARDFKLFLRNQIRDCWTATRPRYIPPSPLAYEDEHPDWLMIETLSPISCAPHTRGAPRNCST